MRKPILSVTAVLLLAFAVWFIFWHPRQVQPTSTVASQTTSANSLPNVAVTPASVGAAAATNSPSPLAEVSSSYVSSHAAQLIPATTAVASLPPATVASNVRHAIRQFGEMFGGDPVGTNPEITRQLLGQNPKHINFVDPAAGMSVDSEGQLVDAWGTPYFFHQISGSEMEVHSAGPDKKMWTGDDIVVK